MNAETISVIGAGTMGSGIAQVAALGGYRVLLYDVAPKFIQRGVERIHQNLAESVARKKWTRRLPTMQNNGFKPRIRSAARRTQCNCIAPTCALT